MVFSKESFLHHHRHGFETEWQGEASQASPLYNCSGMAIKLACGVLALLVGSAAIDGSQLPHRKLKKRKHQGGAAKSIPSKGRPKAGGTT